eukprot:scaffold257809_cov22-Prasinocladus_malaysianus.AAC.2
MGVRVCPPRLPTSLPSARDTRMKNDYEYIAYSTRITHIWYEYWGGLLKVIRWPARVSSSVSICLLVQSDYNTRTCWHPSPNSQLDKFSSGTRHVRGHGRVLFMWVLCVPARYPVLATQYECSYCTDRVCNGTRTVRYEVSVIQA